MKFASLEAFGVHEDMIAAWQAGLGPELLPVQEKAVKAGALEGRSLLVVAPAGSGKTVVAEMAISAAAARRAKAWYLVPTRALAEQKHAELARRFAAAGLRVCITTRDHWDADGALLLGDYDLAVAVPEKARALTAQNPALLAQASLFVVDELELLGDAERGPALEVLLADLLSAGRAQVVGLVASAANAADLAEWLGAELIADSLRPIELRLGVLTEGAFLYREHNTGRWDEEPLYYERLGDGAAGGLGGLALALASRGEQTIVFVRDRATANGLAARLAEAADLPAAEGLAARLADCEATAGVGLLRELAAAGVGLHHSDLQAPERLAVEEALASGELRLLVSTSTLAAGVNLPARNVIIDPAQWQAPATPGARPALGPLPLADLLAMAGRAGRLGYREPFGRAILLADTPMQRDALLDTYVRAEAPDLEPALLRLAADDALVALGVSACAAEEGAGAAWQRTFAARLSGARPEGWEEALADLARLGFFGDDAKPTALLRSAAGGSLGAASLVWLKQFADAPAGRGDWLDLLVVACASPYMARLPFPLRRGELRQVDYVAELEGRGVERGLGGAIMEAALHASDLPPERRQRAAKLVLALLFWASGQPRTEVEAKVRLPAGRVQGLAGAAAWLMDVGAGMAAAAGWPQASVQRLADAARAVRIGVTPGSGGGAEAPGGEDAETAAGPLGLIPGLVKGRKARRVSRAQASPATAPSLAAAMDRGRRRDSAAVGGRAVGESEAAPEEEARPIAAQDGRGQSALRQSPALALDGAQPDQAVVGGKAVRLTVTQFRLLWRLAIEAGVFVRYRPLISYLLGPEEYEGPHQVYSHVSRLRSKLVEAAGEEAEAWLVTLRGVGVKLDLRPETVALKAAAEEAAV